MGTRKNKTIKNKTIKNKKTLNKCKINSIYWINLDRSTERRKLMNEVLKDEVFDDMKKHRVKAFDGLDSKFEKYLQKNVENVNLDKNTLKEYACLLSHIKAIQEFVKSGDDIAIIFEDDVSMEFKKYWKTTLEECICNAPKDWKILQLYYFLGARKKLETNIYTKWHDTMWSALSYVINKKGAKQILKHLIKNNKISLDLPSVTSHVADVYIYSKLKTYVYKYPFFTTVSKDTTIHEEHIHLNFHKKNKKRMSELLKNS
jgi:GR25 family glycosyltransferase involved in LPS biosynthesis